MTNIKLPTKLNLDYSTLPSFERKRFGGKTKVNAFRDGFKLLVFLIKNFLIKN